MIENNNNWMHDQELIKQANKEAKKIYPSGYNKLQLCAIGKRLHEKLAINKALVDADVVEIKEKQASSKRIEEEKIRAIEEQKQIRNKFPIKIINNEDHTEIIAFDLDQFFETVETELEERINEQMDEAPRKIVGGEEDGYFIFEGSRYYGFMRAFWEKSFWYQMSIKNDKNEIVYKRTSF